MSLLACRILQAAVARMLVLNVYTNRLHLYIYVYVRKTVVSMCTHACIPRDCILVLATVGITGLKKIGNR